MGHSIFSWCLKYISPAFVSAAKLCEPVFAAVAAYFLFREAPVPLQDVYKRQYNHSFQGIYFVNLFYHVSAFCQYFSDILFSFKKLP